jgi:F-type H+-transporting ATPase subunit b
MTRAKMTGGIKIKTKRKTKTTKAVSRAVVLFIFVFTCCIWEVAPRFIAAAQDKPSTQNADQAATDKPKTEEPAEQQTQPNQAAPPEHHPTSIAGELAKETRVAEGEEQEEHSDLKHSSMVQKLAKLTGMSVHGAHLFALILNFAVVALLLVWAIRKTVPAIMRTRNESIQRALEEARKASQDAGQRLTDIENRLRQMDVEIGRMQASAEKEAEAEEARIKKAAEDELKKVVLAAEQEIAAAAKQIRRELSVHTADLALALARKQINVDSNTDQVLVRNFAAKLAEPGATATNSDGRKDGR